MAKVAIVTDSTAYIPAAEAQGLPITTIPLNLIWANVTYQDGVDIQPAEFYTRLKDAKEMPSTSQPSPAAFKEVFEKLASEGYDAILTICISSNLSGTMDSATQAKNMLPHLSIELVDSHQAAMGLGFPVLLAARAARQGASLEDCKRIAEQASARSNTYFAANTLEFLHRGGRIGGGAAFLGTALDLKPILYLHDGRVEAFQKIRTMKKARQRLVEIIDSQLNGSSGVHVAVLHANVPDEAGLLMDAIRQKLGSGIINEAFITGVSPVIGAHTGPGTIGVSFMPGM
jgi:DegV family protein with EDD domain